MTVAIAGHAWRTPLGRTVDDVVVRWRAGERAATASPRAAHYPCTIVAPITDEPARSRQARFLRRMGLFGLEVAHEAFAAAAPAGVDRARIGLFAGVGGLRAHWDDMLKGLAHQTEDGADAWQRGLREVHPYWMLRHLSNNVHALAAMELGVRGEGATFGGATGGAQALAAADRALADGAIDAALVVAYDSLLEPETLVELGARHAAALARDPAAIVPGEAAGALVVVRPEAAPAALRLTVAEGADGTRAEPAQPTLDRVLDRVLDRAPDRLPPLDTLDGFGDLGAATSVIQAIALGALVRTGPRVAYAVARGAPGLCAAIRVERPT